MQQKSQSRPLSREASEEQAAYISLANAWACQLDIPYGRQIQQALLDKALRYDSLAVLVSNYDVAKSRLLTKQAKALGHLLDYVEDLMAIETLKGQIAQHKQAQDDIDNLFAF